MKNRMEISPLQWMLTIGSLSLRVVLIPLLIFGLVLVLLIAVLNEIKGGE